MRKRPSVAIVGSGRAGGSIGLALQRAGYDITAAWSNSREGRQRAARLFDAPVLRDPGDAAAAADLAIVSVPDEAIEDIAVRCSANVRRGQYVVHTSGSRSVHALDPLEKRGARIGCLHPLQTLPDAERGADALDGAAVAVTCGASERAFLRRVASAWGGRPFDLSDDHKPTYHAAAVLASSIIVAVVGASEQLFKTVGLRAPREALAPVATAALANVLDRGPRDALTGPVMRGDLAVLGRHIAALGKIPGAEPIVDAYRAGTVLVAQLGGADVEAVRAAIA